MHEFLPQPLAFRSEPHFDHTAVFCIPVALCHPVPFKLVNHLRHAGHGDLGIFAELPHGILPVTPECSQRLDFGEGKIVRTAPPVQHQGFLEKLNVKILHLHDLLFKIVECIDLPGHRDLPLFRFLNIIFRSNYPVKHLFPLFLSTGWPFSPRRGGCSPDKKRLTGL